MKKCNKVSITFIYHSALVHAERLLWTTIVKDAGSHGGKQMYLLLYQTSSQASSVTASWVCNILWCLAHRQTQVHFDMALFSLKTKLHTSFTCIKVGDGLCALGHYYIDLVARLLSGVDYGSECG